MELVTALVTRLRTAPYSEREGIKAELLAAIGGADGRSVREALETAKRGELLEVQWEIEEVLEVTAPRRPVAEAPEQPAEEAPPEAPPEPPDPNRQLTAKDLTLVYDDPRGLLLHKSKVGERWFATQVDQQTRQPQTFELHPQEVAQLHKQLAGSPYWILAAPSPVVAPTKPPLVGR